MCQITYFFGKRPELSQKKSGTMFFKARYQFFFGISRFFLIHHKRYPQDDHSFIFFWKKSWFSIFFLTIFFYKFYWRIFLTSFFQDFFFLNFRFDSNAYGELIFFQKFQKKLLLGPINIVPHVSWNSSGLFSKKQVFWHIDFIVSSIHPDALLFWQKFSTNFIGVFFYEFFFTKKYFIMVILRVTLMANQIFFWNSKKNFRSGLKKHCSGRFLKQLGSFFKLASNLTHRFHSE